MQARDRVKSTTSQPFHVGAVRYIKLGEGGKWASEALSAGTIPFGYRAINHQACARGDWTEVGRQLTLTGRQKGGVAQGLRELKDFYALGDDTLWFTVANGQVWWTFAHGPVIEGPKNNPDSPSRYRRTCGGWRDTSLQGTSLSVPNLSSALTNTANYRMTICAV